MKRRALLLAGASGAVLAANAPLLAPLARAQLAGRSYRVAIVLTTSPIAEMLGSNPAHPLTRVILHELASLGYIEGGNLIFERRTAEGRRERFPEIIAEMIRLQTDVIILSADRELIRAAQKATRTTPIVLMGYARAVEDGFAASLSRPGGNITGITFQTDWEFEAKRFELLKEIAPQIARVAYLAPRNYWDGPQAQSVRRAASASGVALIPIEQNVADLKSSFAAISRERVDAVFAAPSSALFAQRKLLGVLALQLRLPATFAASPVVEAGGLMSYGANVVEEMRKIAHYVDKIIKGANPAELAMERPTKFELVINLRTARAIGLPVPQSVILRADRVIE